MSPIVYLYSGLFDLPRTPILIVNIREQAADHERPGRYTIAEEQELRE